jgi:hypothetical protein
MFLFTIHSIFVRLIFLPFTFMERLMKLSLAVYRDANFAASIYFVTYYLYLLIGIEVEDYMYAYVILVYLFIQTTAFYQTYILMCLGYTIKWSHLYYKFSHFILAGLLVVFPNALFLALIVANTLMDLMRMNSVWKAIVGLVISYCNFITILPLYIFLPTTIGMFAYNCVEYLVHNYRM